MSIEPSSKSLADGIFEALGAEIVRGDLPPGSQLPSEIDLTQRFGVNRHVVREALKRLAQLGVLSMTRGGRTRVLDIWEHGGLDLLAAFADHARGGPDAVRIWLSVLQMRAAITADIVRVAASVEGDELAERLTAITVEMRACAEDQDKLLALNRRFFKTMVLASGNVAYRLAMNTFERAIDASIELTAPYTRAEVQAADYHRELAAAIAAHDPDGAVAALRAATQTAADAYAIVAATWGFLPPEE